MRSAIVNNEHYDYHENYKYQNILIWGLIPAIRILEISKIVMMIMSAIGMKIYWFNTCI